MIEEDYLTFSDDDVVNKPSHYNQGKIEVCDFIIDQKMGFLEGNIVKYISRYKRKNGIEDLKKKSLVH